MAAAFVKCTKLVGAINSNAASATVSATAGNLLIAVASVYYGGTATTPTLTVSGGGTWTLDSRDNQHFSASNDNFCNGFAHVPTATGGSATFTVTWGVTATGAVAIGYIYEFSGAPGTFDAAGTGIQNTASPVLSPTFTNPTASDIMLAVGATYSSGTESHGAPTNSWTTPTNGDETNGNSFLTGVTAYKIVSASAAQSTSSTVSPSVASATHIVAYKAAATTTFNLAVSATQAQSLVLVQSRVFLRTVTATQAQTLSVAPRVPTHYSLTVTASQSTSVSMAVGLAHLPVNYYSTTFPLTENPISEGSVWTLGGRDALDWTNPRTTTNKVFGTQSGTDPAVYTDSIGVLRGTWGADQEVSALIYSSVGSLAAYCEVELLLRFTVTPHSVTGYEITMNVQPSQNYLSINRWTGGAGNLSSSYVQIFSAGGLFVNGDLMRATMIGSTITVYRNGASIATVTDTTYTSGAPGIGFFNDNNPAHADPSLYGFTRFTAHTVGTPWPLGGNVLQGQSLRLANQAQIRRTLGQAEAVSLSRGARLVRLINEITAVSMPLVPRIVPLSRAITQAQTVGITARKVILRTLIASQGQAPRLEPLTRLVRLLNVSQVLSFSKSAGPVRTLSQAQTVSLLVLRLGTTYPVSVSTSVATHATLSVSTGTRIVQVTVTLSVVVSLSSFYVASRVQRSTLKPYTPAHAPVLTPAGESDVPPLRPG